MSLVAFAAILVWSSVFADPWPCNWRGAVVALVVLIAIVVEAAFAWILARGMRPKGTVPTR